MKKLLTCLSLLLITSVGVAQQNELSDRKENALDLSKIERSEKLNRLYLESKTLNKIGTAEEINANRLTVMEAWEEVSPEVASFYKSTHSPELRPVASKRNFAPTVTSSRPADAPNTVQVLESFADYIDMKIAANGDIYIASAPWDEKNITISRSTDNGNTWSIYDEVSPLVHVRKMKMALLSGIGQEYLNVYYMGDDNKLHLFTVNLGDGDSSNGTYGTLGEIKDFSITNSIEASTGLQRVFMMYVKMDDETFRARTAPGNYGRNFIDNTSTGMVLKYIDIAYGYEGSVYQTYVGVNSGRLYVEAHPDNFDPGTTNEFSYLGDDTTYEFSNPSVAASRKVLESDNAIVTVSKRLLNTSDPFRQEVFQRKNQEQWNSIFLSPYIPVYGLTKTSTFVRNEAGNEVIRTSYLESNINIQNGEAKAYSHTYNGNTMDDPQLMSDPDLNIWNPIIGETADGRECMAYIREYQETGYGVYFTSPNSLNVQDQTIGNLSVYPVPARESVTVSAHRPIENVVVNSILGQKVVEVSNNTNELTIDTSTFAKGIYFLEIHSEGKSETRKIIKE